MDDSRSLSCLPRSHKQKTLGGREQGNKSHAFFSHDICTYLVLVLFGGKVYETRPLKIQHPALLFWICSGLTGCLLNHAKPCQLFLLVLSSTEEGTWEGTIAVFVSRISNPSFLCTESTFWKIENRGSAYTYQAWKTMSRGGPVMMQAVKLRTSWRRRYVRWTGES